MVGGAWAQEPSGFDAHGFHLAPFDADLRDGLSVIRPGDFESGDFFAGGVMEYAKAPLVAIRDGQRTAVVDDVLALNVSAGMALHERARLVVGAPVYLAVTGQEQVGGAIGDVRLGSTFVLVRPSDASGIGVGLSPWFDVPTGPDERFLGTGAAAGGVVAALTAERDSLTLTANAGPRFKPQLERANLTGSDALVLGLGLGYLVSTDVALGADLLGEVPFVPSDSPGSTAPWQGQVYGRWVTETGGHLLGGVGTALSGGVGAAAFRLFVGGGFGQVSSDGPPEAVVAETSEPAAPDTVGFQVTASLDGEGIDGAEVALDGPETLRVTTPAELQVEPRTLWRASASLGACLSGEAIGQIHDADGGMDIPLQWMAGGRMRLLVLNADGVPIRGVSVSFESSDEGCAPQSPIVLDAAGSASFAIGRGAHRVRVEADGYVDHVEDVEVEDGEMREVIALMMPVAD